jgi:hypothetical protein
MSANRREVMPIIGFDNTQMSATNNLSVSIKGVTSNG